MKPLASLSLDLDNKWSYLKTHGSPAWESFPSYLDLVVPRVLDFLRERNLSITFFVVGQDAALEKNHGALRAIADAGHEIGNHSFNHEPWLHLYSEDEIETELRIAEEHIERATGKKPTGFRGPGFSLSEATLRVLARRGYRYDATAFPNLLNPLARSYFFMTSNLSAEEKRKRKALFGTLGDALRPVKPYQWTIDDISLPEIPVTTMPLFKIPIHFSYLLYLAKFSPWLARVYFRFAIRLCLITGTAPSLLLHPLDFLGKDDVDDLAFFPAMDQPGQAKVDLMAEFIDLVVDRFEPVTMAAHAEQVANVQDLPEFEPKFKHA